MANAPRVWTFFYGTFMSAEVLSGFGVNPEQVVPAKLDGFRLTIQPRANLIDDAGASVYGSIALLTHNELDTLYRDLEQTHQLVYRPRAVLTQAIDSSETIPALCYFEHDMTDAVADPEYVAKLAQCVRALNHPESFAKEVERFAR